ncbi:integrase family protein [Paramagnetospirillum caucaseum]|uniref:Integrase family protein n=1 Tax=Paramagnetospirillum caucaseum TaxID=1244869 RepID=M2Y4F2_9PROT|nr:integrase family protein [Paramagnetospirillum caucaseum]
MLEIAEREGLRPITPTTANQKYLAHVRTFFDWCIAAGKCTTNPATDISVSALAKKGRLRNPFTMDELGTVLKSPIWYGCKSPDRVFDPGTTKVRDWRWWLFPLGLLTGCRLGELCSLTVDQVLQNDGVWYIDIVKAKSEAGVRRVPLHPTIMQMGFLAHVENMRQKGYETIWPGLNPKGGYLSNRASHWHADLLNLALGKEQRTARKVVYHSTRHNFIDRLRAARVPKDIRHAIVGHEPEDRNSAKHVEDDYGLGYEVSVLAEWVSRVEYPGLILPTP